MCEKIYLGVVGGEVCVGMVGEIREVVGSWWCEVWGMIFGFLGSCSLNFYFREKILVLVWELER